MHTITFATPTETTLTSCPFTLNFAKGPAKIAIAKACSTCTRLALGKVVAPQDLIVSLGYDADRRARLEIAYGTVICNCLKHFQRIANPALTSCNCNVQITTPSTFHRVIEEGIVNSVATDVLAVVAWTNQK